MKHLKEYRTLYLVGVLLFLVGFIWQQVFAHTGTGKLTVVFMDIGQGDAIFIEAPNGNQMLIDGGPGKSVLRELGHVMPFFDHSIDVVIATHPDADHIGGLPDVFRRYEVQYFFEPGVENDTGVSRALREEVTKQGIRRIEARRGTTIALDHNVHFNILFPDRDVTELESNAASIIGQLVYGETEFLFTGDSPQSIEKYIVSLDGKKLQSDVLKVGHHGSKTSSEDSFLAAVLPSYAVISAGRDNRYGHPHAEVITRLEDLDATTMSTYKNGSILFESNGHDIILKH